MSERLSNNSEKQLEEKVIKKMGKTAVDHIGDYERPSRVYETLEQVNFSEVISEDKLKKQNDYVQRVEKKFDKLDQTTAGKMAKKFEEMFITGVNQGDWLGKVKAEAISTTRYDDYRHRADAVITLKLEDSKDIEAIGGNSLVFAVDVTASGRQSTIQDKLTRINNDTSDELPFGFTSIDRYARRDGSNRKRLDMVPRFVVGMSITDVINTDKSWPKNKSGRLCFNVFNKDSGFNLATRFKFLSEINSQITAYDGMLPKEADSDEEREQIAMARNQLDVAKKVIAVALNETAGLIVSGESGLLSKETKMELSNAVSPLKKRAAIMKKLEENGNANLAEYRKRMREHGNNPDPDYKDTYTYISKMSDRLAELSKGKSKLVQSQKKIGAHNATFEF